jgi:tRNA 2-thiouridine synthesizing protein A
MRLYRPRGDPLGDPSSGGKPFPPDPLGPQDPSAAAAGSGPFFEPERTVVPPSGLVPALTIDALGRKCPIPIIMLAEQIRDVPLGAVVAVLADDPAAYTDVPSWCAMKAQEFAGYTELASGWALYIRRMLLGPTGP